MKYSGNMKLLCELSRFSKLNACILLGYLENNDASILDYKYHPTGFNIYAENTQPQLIFLAFTLETAKVFCVYFGVKAWK